MSEDVIVLEPGDERAKKIGKAMSSPTSGGILSLLQSGDMTLSDITDNLGIPMTTAKYHVENLLDSGMIEVRRIKYSEKGREVKVYGASGQVVIVSAGNKDLRSLLLKYASVFGLLILASLFVFTISGILPGMIPQDLNQGISPDAMLLDSPDYENTGALTAAASSENYSGGYSGSNAPEQTAVPEPVTAKSAMLPEIPEDGQKTGGMQKADVQAYTVASDNGNEVQVEVISEEAAEERAGDYRAAMLTAGYAGSDSGSGATGVSGDSYPPANMIHMMVLSFFFGGCLVLVILMIYETVIWRKEKSYWREYNKSNMSGDADKEPESKS